MRLDDLPAVHAIERASFSAPWPPDAYRSELETNRLAHYLVARVDDEIVGLRRDVADGRRGATSRRSPSTRPGAASGSASGCCSRSSTSRSTAARARRRSRSGCRTSPARRLYEKYGFRPVGLRPRYYSDNGEDALIMTTEPLADAGDARADRRACARRSTPRRRRPGPTRRRTAVDRRTDRARERAARPRRSSRRATRPASRSSRAAGGSTPTSSPRQVALHAPTGGIVPEVAARAHLRWIVPVLDEALGRRRRRRGTTSTAVAVTYGPGLAGSLLVGINFAKALAWVHDKPLVGGQPPRGPRLRRVAARSRRGRARPSRSFPLVALVVSGGHTFLVEMRDHLTYRLLGTTVDDAAGEAFDKVGRLLGLGYPGGPAIQRAAEARDARTTASSRGPGCGDSYDFSFSGLKTAARRIVDRGARRRRACADDPDAPLPDAVVAELAWGFQDSVVDVLATKTIRAAADGRRPVDRARRRRGRERGAARRGSRARPRRSACR